MSDKTKNISLFIANLSFVVAIIFWSGFTYSEVKENKKGVVECRSNQEYINRNMVTKQDIETLKKDLFMFYKETRK